MPSDPSELRVGDRVRLGAQGCPPLRRGRVRGRFGDQVVVDVDSVGWIQARYSAITRRLLGHATDLAVPPCELLEWLAGIQCLGDRIEP